MDGVKDGRSMIYVWSDGWGDKWTNRLINGEMIDKRWVRDKWNDGVKDIK